MTRFSMSRCLGVVLVSLLLALTLAVGANADSGPVEPRQPNAESRCPVCGMLVAPHGDWLAQIVFDRGQALFFDGAKDLFRYHLDPDRFQDAPAVKKRGTLFVTSYYDRKLIRARDAYYVIGSDVLGPMGPELIPLASREAAEEFQRDHGGSAILAFDDVTAELMSAMR